MRKVLGSNRSQLIRQFLSESVFLFAVAVSVSIIMVIFLIPYFNDFTGKEVSLSFFDNLYTILLLVLFTLTTGILSGLYPAFFVSSIRPASIFKGKIFSGKNKKVFQNILLVLQFAISITVITGTFVVNRQLDYIQNRDLGFDKENVLIVEKSSFRLTNREAYRQELLKNPNILNVSFTNNYPGTGLANALHYPEVADAGKGVHLNMINADYNFTQTLGLKIKQGRTFSREMLSDTAAVILNEKAVEVLGIGEPVGRRIIGYDPNSPDRMIPKTIIGVYEDFHFASLHSEIKPFMVQMLPKGFAEILLVRIKPEDVTGTIGYIKDLSRQFDPGDIYSYRFLDEQINALYDIEIRTRGVLSVFSFLTIFIACLGLFGLVSYAWCQRKKEVSIRKLLGASELKIAFLFTRELAAMIISASILAIPAAYFILNSWLRNFAYRTELSVFYFVFSFTILLPVIIVSVSVLLIKASKTNPVDNLRSE